MGESSKSLCKPMPIHYISMKIHSLVQKALKHTQSSAFISQVVAGIAAKMKLRIKSLVEDLFSAGDVIVPNFACFSLTKFCFFLISVFSCESMKFTIFPRLETERLSRSRSELQ